MNIVPLVVALSIAVTQPEGDAPESNAVDPSVYSRIRSLADESDRLIRLYERLEEAPVKPTMWQPLTSSKSEIDGRIDRLAESVESLLLPESYGKFTRSYANWTAEIDRLRAEIAELKQRRLYAPDERLLIDPVTVTKSAIDSYVEDKLARIEKREQDLEELCREYTDTLQSRYNIALTPDQIEALMVRSDGDETVRSIVVVGVLGEIMVGLEHSLEATGENTEVAEKYYRLVVLSYETLVRQWERHQAKYNDEWYPQLAEMEQRSAALASDLRAKMRENVSEANREVLAQNIENAAFQQSAIRRYRSELRDQESQVGRALSQARENLEVAKLTLESVSIAGDLLAVMQASQSEFQMLLETQLPTIRPFENSELKAEFVSITSEMESMLQ